MYVDNANHGHAMCLIIVDPLRKVGHVVNLNESINVQLHFVNICLDQLLYALFSQASHEQAHQRHTCENYNNMAVDV
jgi:hypothetical protein